MNAQARRHGRASPHLHSLSVAQFEPCPEVLATWALLVPPNLLVSSRDLIPGVQRVAPAGPPAMRPGSTRSRSCGSGSELLAPTRGVLGAHSLLDPPQLQAVHAVLLSGLQLALPEGFVEVARQQAAQGGRLPPVRDLPEMLCLRVSVHNGRRFVGPPLLCAASALTPVEGQRGVLAVLFSLLAACTAAVVGCDE